MFRSGGLQFPILDTVDFGDAGHAERERTGRFDRDSVQYGGFLKFRHVREVVRQERWATTTFAGDVLSTEWLGGVGRCNTHSRFKDCDPPIFHRHPNSFHFTSPVRNRA